jgi:hypothetical protein
VTQAVEILTELQRRGVSATVEGETLCLRPKHALDEDLLARIRETKPDILEALKRPERCAASCYQVEPGYWIHRPWDGCKTIQPAQAERRLERKCFHCCGSGACRCVACGRKGSCLPCQGTGKTLDWVQ